jgi:hypothetical protein
VWDELTPPARAKATEILKAHPRYTADLLQGVPQNSSEEETARYALAAAATWPDLVRQQSHPMHFVASHPNWHYIDIPYEVGGQTAPTPPPQRDAGPRDIVEALTKNADDLRSADVTAANRAIALCWVLHLGGDIHQPLHAATMVSPQFPKGDQGGLQQIVLRDPPFTDSQMSLHVLWDELPGQYHWEHLDELLAEGLRNDPRYSREHFAQELAEKDFARWARESYELAVKYAYLNGTIKSASAQQIKRDPTTPIPGLPPGYVASAERVAMERVVLAGYRTADLLNSLLDGK